MQSAARSFDHVLAARQTTYPICDRLPSLLASVDDYKLRLPDVYSQQKAGTLWCGKERQGWFRRVTVPWSECAALLSEAKRELLAVVGNLCANQRTANLMNSVDRPRPRPLKRGVVYTGMQRHFRDMHLSLLSLRHLGSTLPVEIFTDARSVSRCRTTLAAQFHNTSCHALPLASHGFTSKFYAVSLSSFSEALFIDADTIVLRDPIELFHSQDFLEHGSLWWPDLWGAPCRALGIAYGETAFDTHVFYAANVLGIPWRDVRNTSQEVEASLFMLDLNRYLPLLELAVYFLEDKFFGRMVYGDKDVLRIVHLVTGAPMTISAQIPASAVILPRHNEDIYRDSLVHFAGNRQDPFLFHQLKSKRSEPFEHIFRLTSEMRDKPSVCLEARFILNSSVFEEMTLANSGYDAVKTSALVADLFARSNKFWATV